MRSAGGEPSWVALLRKEWWCWGRKDWREAFAMAGWPAGEAAAEDGWRGAEEREGNADKGVDGVLSGDLVVLGGGGGARRET